MTECAKNERFSDRGELVCEFGDEFLVVRPKCAGKAKVLREGTDSEKLNERFTAPRRLVFFDCVFRDHWRGGAISIGASVDWYFRLPLWLSTPSCGEALRAYNEKHLEFIENYAAALLRERVPRKNKSLASGLPRRITKAKNRDEVSRAIAKLKEKLNEKS